MSGRGDGGRRQSGSGPGVRAARPWGLVGLAAVILLAAGGWYLLRPSRASRIAAETIRLQAELLAGEGAPAASAVRIEEIMRNVDRLPPDEIRRVRESLFRRLKEMREESLSRFHDALPVERTTLLDADLERIQIAQAIVDATDQGGMRTYTEAELIDRERRRREREAERKQAAPGTTKASPAPVRQPAPKRQPTDEQKRSASYFEALAKRAKEKKVELGRLFGRPPG
jgi:hypothetical protein